MPSSIRTVKLNDGTEIPIFAFGTGTAQAFKDSSETVFMALANGVIHLDAAWHYKNQTYTGRALAQAKVQSGEGRQEVYVSSKGGDFEGSPEDCDLRRMLEVGLKDLGLDYVDMYLIHADFLVGDIVAAWRVMERIKRDGLSKSIGVSNFSSGSLQTILDNCEIKPALNQIEFHPYSLPTYTPTLLPLMREHGILLAGYAPLMSLVRQTGGPVDDAVRQVVRARGLGESEARLLTMWNHSTTTSAVRLCDQLEPFMVDSAVPPLSGEHIDLITKAGAASPYRHWGTMWPYYMQGEGGINACGPGKTHGAKPEIRLDLMTQRQREAAEQPPEVSS